MRQQLSPEDQIQLLELENKALRFQVDSQTKIIQDLQAELVTVKDDLRVLDRYRMLVERASIIARDIPGVKEALLARSQVKKQDHFVQVDIGKGILPERATLPLKS